MGRPKKVVEEVITEVVKEEVKLPKAVFEKTVVMIRSEDYPMPREANVHLEEVANWQRHGWVKA
jgi:predicted ATP-grasp superfamily ATP-dependent carboligase